MLTKDSFIRWSIKITHEPTGESVRLDSSNHRNPWIAKDIAWKMLQGRLYAEQNGMGRNKELVRNYLILEDVPYPDRLEDHERRLPGRDKPLDRY